MDSDCDGADADEHSGDKVLGKEGEPILPINDSISVTLDTNHLCTTTSIAVSPAFTNDRMWLNGKEVSLSGGRFQNCLRELRARASDYEDEKKGIKITKKDWEKLNVHIVSYNNFPTAAGLASSAAGLACLVGSWEVTEGGQEKIAIIGMKIMISIINIICKPAV